ncbi:MAG: DUF3137 domain-containing protein [Phycisphaerae bacterium]
MGLLRDIFGPSKDEIWSQFAASVNGQFIDGGFLGKDQVTARAGQWTITLDSFTRSSGSGSTSSSTTYTRMRAPFVNPEQFRFTIYREHIFSGLGKMLGCQDVEIGDVFFDSQFVIKSNMPDRARQLLADDRLKRFIHAQPQINLTVKDDEGWFGTDFPAGVDELYFECRGLVRDVERLRHLYGLFATTLQRLVAIGSAYANDPGVRL